MALAEWNIKYNGLMGSGCSVTAADVASLAATLRLIKGEGIEYDTDGRSLSEEEISRL